MVFFQNLSLRTKLILASLIPLIGLLYYLQINLRHEFENMASAQQAISDVNIVHEMSKVLHELQKERALTLANSGENNVREDEAISLQWESTNQAINAFENMMNEYAVTLTNRPALDSLSFVRAKINAANSMDKVDIFYTRLKSDLLNEIARIGRSTTRLTLKNSFEEHLYLLYAKDFMASLRSELGSAIVDKEFTGMKYGNFVTVKGKHEVYFNNFLKMASPDLRAYFDRKFQGAFIQETQSIINAAYTNPEFTDFKYDFSEWWSVSSSSINALKEIEDYSSSLIRKMAGE